LIVDRNGVLSLPVIRQRVKFVARQHLQVVEAGRGIDHQELVANALE
jgi:hypothetical protein